MIGELWYSSKCDICTVVWYFKPIPCESFSGLRTKNSSGFKLTGIENINLEDTLNTMIIKDILFSWINLVYLLIEIYDTTASFLMIFHWPVSTICHTSKSQVLQKINLTGFTPKVFLRAQEEFIVCFLDEHRVLISDVRITSIVIQFKYACYSSAIAELGDDEVCL